jgi:carbon storage regulator
MLVLARKTGEWLDVGDDVQIQIVRISGGGVTLGVIAPKHLRVDRREIRERIKAGEVRKPRTDEAA